MPLFGEFSIKEKKRHIYHVAHVTQNKKKKINKKHTEKLCL